MSTENNLKLGKKPVKLDSRTIRLNIAEKLREHALVGSA